MKVTTSILFLMAWLTCQAMNTTPDQSSVNRASTATNTHGGIGDYVAAGLGVDTRETSSSLASTPNLGDYVAIGLSMSSREASPSLTTATMKDTWAQLSTTAILTAVGLATVTSAGLMHKTTNIANVTSSTDCWHSWLAYWSASSLNQVTYQFTSYTLDITTETGKDASWTYISPATLTTTAYKHHTVMALPYRSQRLMVLAPKLLFGPLTLSYHRYHQSIRQSRRP